MAYGRRYQMQWKNTNGNGWLYIEEKDYSGATETLKLLNDAIFLTRDFTNWETHIIGQTCEFNIVNDKDDFFSLKPLMVATERKYKILVYAYEDITLIETRLFEGWVNTEAVQQKYLQLQVIKMVASSFVMQLDNVYPTSLDTLGAVTFIDTISEILLQAGNEFPIRVSSELLSNESTEDLNKSFMNQNGMYNEIFWENNIDRVDSRTILEQILTSFNCYMYYWDGYWYIEDFTMLWKTDKAYIQYEPNQRYSPADNGTRISLTFTIGDIQDLYFMSRSQIISVNPGKRQVIVRIDDKTFFNMLLNDFSDIIRVSDFEQYPIRNREWLAFQPDAQTYVVWEDEGLPYSSMVNSIKRTTSYPPEDRWINFPYPHAGLYTRFVFTLTPEGNDLELAWKWSTGADPHNLIEYIQRWKISLYTPEGLYVGDIQYDPSDTNVWRMVDGSGFGTNGVNEVGYGADAFETDRTLNVSVNIPLGEVFYLNAGTYIAVFRILHDYNKDINDKNVTGISSFSYYGDPTISLSTNAFVNNYIEGTVNTDFIKKLEIDVDLADMPNFNYKNGILAGDNLDVLTKFWSREDTTQRELVNFIMIDKFRMANVSRQRISANTKFTDGFLRPFSMYIDPLDDDRKYLVTGMRHNVTKDEYRLTLDEYDNDTPVNLIEE